MTQYTENGDSEYLAKPSRECCLKGHIHNGKPRGTYERIADVETYIVSPSAGRANGHILLYFPDVWGFFVNGLLIMDGFANEGYLTVGLDYFRGVSRHFLSGDSCLNCPSARVSGLLLTSSLGSRLETPQKSS